MNILDEYGESLTLIDSDTAVNKDGERFRVRGFDGLETDKVIKDKDGNWIVQRGEIGADFQTKKVGELLSTGNFFAKYSDEIDKSKGERRIIDFINNKGENAATELYKQGIASVDSFTSEENILAQRDMELSNALLGNSNTPYDKIGEEYRNTMATIPLRFKEKALNEREYNKNIHSGVAFRDPSKTIDNQPLGFWNSGARSFGVGADGVFEGLYGYIDALGQMTDIEMIENFGERNVIRIRDEMSQAPQLLLNYKDVDSITDGFQYAMNTAGMAAPYMIAGFSSLAAAIPLGALTTPAIGMILSQIPQTMVYAGHTWNEMEGEKGLSQFVIANMSGVLQATLERVGLRGLMQPVDLLSVAGRNRALKHIVNNNKGMTIQQAEIVLNAQLKGAIKEQVKFLGKDFAKLSAATFGKAAAKGMTREGLTEIGQELTQAVAVTAGSDTTFTDEELKNRLMNAGIGGAILGGAYGSAGNIYRQGKNQLTKKMYLRADDTRSTPIEQKRLEDEKAGKLNDTNRRVDQDIARQEANVKDRADPSNPDGLPTVTVYDTNGQPHKKILVEGTPTKPIKVRDLLDLKEEINKDKIIVYDLAGNPIIATVIAISELGTKKIKLEDGSEHILNQGNYHEQSIYDGIDFNTGNVNQTVNSKGFTKEEIENLLPKLESQLKAMKDAGATDQLGYSDLILKINALRIRLKVLNGQTVIKPDNSKITKEHTLNKGSFFTMSALNQRFVLSDGSIVNELSKKELQARKAALFNEYKKRKEQGKVFPSDLGPISAELKAIQYQLERIDEPQLHQDIPSLPDTKFDKTDKKNKQIVGDLAREHEDTDRGTYNFIANSDGLKDFVVNATTNVAKLFRAVENYMLDHKKLVTSDIALKIWSRIAGLTSAAYLTGRNFVEYARDIVSDLKSYVDENDIAMDLTGDTLTASSAVDISKELIEFGKSGNFKAIKAILFATTIHDLDVLASRERRSITGPNLLKLYQELNRTVPRNKDEEADLERRIRVIEEHLADKFGIQTYEITDVIDYINNNSEVVNELDSNNRPTGKTQRVITDKFKLLKKIIKDKKTGNYITSKDSITSEAEFDRMTKLFIAASKIKASYDKSFQLYAEQVRKERNQNINDEYDPDYWWTNQGFDWKKVKRNPVKFKKWLIGTKNITKEEAERMYITISREGTSSINEEFSLVDGKPYQNFSFNPKFKMLYNKKGFEEFSSQNLFEALNRNQIEISKFVSSAEYFGDGGWKLNQLFDDLKKETQAGLNNLDEKDIRQFAYYTKAIIDSAHGNFNRIASNEWAAVNRYLTSWTIFSGLPLAAIASIPETAMVYFNLKDDQEFKRATDIMVKDLASIFNKALKADVKNTEKLLKQIGLATDQNTVVDRYATGERDIAFLRAHEAFFKGVGIQKITQFQRRLNAAIGLDFIKSNFSILRLAPRRYNQITGDRNAFDFDKFTERERLTYNQLKELGIDVESVDQYVSGIDELLRDSLFDLSDNTFENRQSPLDILFDVTTKVKPRVGKEFETMPVYDKEGKAINQLKGISPREQLLRTIARGEFKSRTRSYQDGTIERVKNKLRINEQKLVDRVQELAASLDDEIETGIYRFVNERVQLPGASNRPLFFQDPHYQLLTQFNGFLSTFTANIVPKLWNRNLRKGNTKVKYDTFALMIFMIGLGGASQYLKDLIKFLEPSPYLDGPRYVQRAIYASGILGQYERVLDFAVPLYPDRDTGLDNLSRAILGEAGPAARNIQNVFTGMGQLIEGETERAINSFGKTLPGVAPVPVARKGISDAFHLKNPLNEDLSEYLFGKQ